MYVSVSKVNLQREKMIRQEVREATSLFITSVEADVDKQKQKQKEREEEKGSGS